MVDEIKMPEWISQVAWNESGLVPAIAQDDKTKEVLMLAWMNQASLSKTIESGFAHYYSRSRKKLWKKGEESGHLQAVQDIRLDCDGDTILLLVKQYGGIACHTGRANCFFHRLESCESAETKMTQSTDPLHWHVFEPIIKDMRLSEHALPDGVDENAIRDVLFRLFESLKQRQHADPQHSYVAKLLSKGENAVLKKVGEEATELVMAAKERCLDQVVYETADLWFHSLIVLLQQGGSLEQVLLEIQRREGISGLDEFAQREKKS
jgi:phosphoribosyl-ATP pyrophosphohydrolase/phosphoribosyl-AMP cyclohydrolase